MDPQKVFCPNLDCPARGQVGQGNIGVHSHRERRDLCHVCHQTFAETKGTVFYRLRTAPDGVTLVLTLLAYGCPLQAMVAAFGLDERTVADWQARAGQHCERVHEQLVQQPRDLGQVQADEICVKRQNAVGWLGMAMPVSTRLWLGGVIGAQRDEALLTVLVQRIRARALCRPVWLCVDGWRADLRACQAVFREAIPSGRTGRPHLRPWDGIVMAQGVKPYAQGHGVGVVRRIVPGIERQVRTLLQATQGGGVINTAYIERLNATFRARLAGLVRRGRRVLRHPHAPSRCVFDWNGVQFLHGASEFACAAVCRAVGAATLGLSHSRHGSWHHRSLLDCS